MDRIGVKADEPNQGTLAGDRSFDSLDSSLPMPPPAKRRRLPVGTLVNGRYQVRELLGEGGMGVVYRVDDLLHPERPVALKTIPEEHLRGDHVSLLKSEFKTMTGLRHPNVATVYDFEPLQGTAHHLFTMEYIAGRDLYSATERAECDAIIELLAQVCRALSYLHSRRVIHFDLKPANILVDERGQVRVLDFGLASADHGRALSGTPAYMAPEMYAADSVVDHRADLYSLGIVAYQLLCRRTPFTAASPMELLRKHASERVVFDAEASARSPAWLRRVISRLCEKDPAERYRSANAVIDDVNRLSGSSHPLETAATRESYILSTRFVGREVERERLLQFVWERTGTAPTSAGTSALLVAGTSGVGKSRLVREIKQQAQLGGLTFIECNCYEGTFAELNPVAEALGHLVKLARAVGAEDLIEAHAATLRRVDPNLVAQGAGPAETSEPEAYENRDAQRRLLLDELGALFVSVAARTPYVLYFNDLQWARPATIEVLINLLSRLRNGAGVRLALVGSYRSDEVEGRPLARLLSFDTEGSVVIVPLAPLAPAEIARLLGSMLGIEALPVPFVERVARETAGNPFFVEEVMRSLVDRGAVYLESGAWAATTAIGELEIPATIASVFRRRTALLDGAARDMFNLLAVYGRPVPAPLLALLRPDEDTAPALRALMDRQMVTRTVAGDVAYSISHDRMRETLYADLPDERRRSLHRAIAERLEARPDDEGVFVHELAHHFWHAGEHERALRYSLTAGDKSLEAYANDLALEHFERALTLLPEGDPRRLEVSEKLADLECLTGRFEQARARYVALLADRDDELVRARLLRKQGQLHVQTGDMNGSLGPLWDAVELLGRKRPRSGLGSWFALLAAVVVHLVQRFFGPIRRARNPADRARLLELCSAYRGLGLSYFFLDPSKFLTAALSACNAAERAGDSQERCRIYGEVAFLYAYLAMNDAAVKLADRAVAMAERLRSTLEIGASTAFRGMIATMMCRYDEALRVGARARALLFKHGDFFMLTVSESNIEAAHFASGRTRAAADSAEEIAALVERTGSQSYGKAVLAAHGYYRGHLGDGVAARLRLAQAQKMAADTGDQQGMLTVLAFRGHLELLDGEVQRAIATLEEARQIILRTRSSWYHVGIILAVLVLARLEAAPARLSRVERQAIGRIVASALAHSRRRPQFRALALLAHAAWAWRAGRTRLARRKFAACMALAAAQGNAWVLADARFELGRALGQAGQRDEARPLLAQAAADYERFEMAPSLARARAALGALV
jgi:tetratricopeptide (TPR) repeat protein